VDSELITLLANAGTAGITIVLIVTGLLVPKWAADDLRARLRAAERRADASQDQADAAVAAAQASRDIFAAIEAGMNMHRSPGRTPPGEGL